MGPVGGDGIVFLQDGSPGNRTRATIKAHPAAPHRPRPYGIWWACSELDAYWLTLAVNLERGHATAGQASSSRRGEVAPFHPLRV